MPPRQQAYGIRGYVLQISVDQNRPTIRIGTGNPEYEAGLVTLAAYSGAIIHATDDSKIKPQIVERRVPFGLSQPVNHSISDQNRHVLLQLFSWKYSHAMPFVQMAKLIAGIDLLFEEVAFPTIRDSSDLYLRVERWGLAGVLKHEADFRNDAFCYPSDWRVKLGSHRNPRSLVGEKYGSVELVGLDVSVS